VIVVVILSHIVSTETWMTLESNDLGANQSFLFSSDLDFGNSSGSAGHLELQYHLFSNTTGINLGDASSSNHLYFTTSPAFVKLSVRINNWQWQSADNPDERGHLRIAIDACTRITELASAYQYVRAFSLTGQNLTYVGLVATQLLLAEAVELDGELVWAHSPSENGRKAVELTLDEERSELVLSFTRFNSTLLYDPG
jgi:hypothetical protein